MSDPSAPYCQFMEDRIRRIAPPDVAEQMIAELHLERLREQAKAIRVEAKRKLRQIEGERPWDASMVASHRRTIKKKSWWKFW